MTQSEEAIAPVPKTRWEEVRATVSLAGPMVLTMVAVIFMETVDTLMIGRLGEEALAAAALALTTWFIPLLFGIGLLGAVSSLTAQAVAQNDDRGVRRSARQGLWAGIMLGAPSALAMTQAEHLLIWIGQLPEIASAAQEYLNWMGLALIVIFLNIPLRLTMASYEVTRPAMLIVWAGVPLNALFNWIFMFGGLGGPEMGLAGAGVATLLVDILIVIGVAICITKHSKTKHLNLFQNFWRPDWPRFRQLMRIGLPSGAIGIMEHGLFAAAAVMMGWVGVTQLASHMVATQIVSITFMIPFGLGQASNIRIALAAGARNLDAARIGARTQIEITVIFMAACAVVYWLFGDFFVGLFLAADDPDRAAVIGYGASFLAIAAIFQIFDGVQVVGGGILRGLNDTFVPMLFAIFGYWMIGVTGAYWLCFELGLGGAGIWYGLIGGLGICAIAVAFRIWQQTRTADLAFSRIE